jgi:superfamily II DNA or RNA helicase
VTERDYSWQQAFHNDARTWFDNPVNERMAFLLNVCPGGGKTRATVTLCAPDVLNEEAFLIVVTPSLAVSRQWVDAAHDFGIELSSRCDRMTSDFHGIVITNQALNNAADDLIAFSARRQVKLIVDEAHHSSEENGVWGVAVNKMLEVATWRLMLTGTAFRTDGTRIPFLRYDERGVAQADFLYTYRDAVRDRVNRPLQTYAIDGHGGLSIDGEHVTYDVSNAPDGAVPAVMKSIFRPEGDWLKARLNDVANSLEAQQQNASFKCAALVVCTDTAHANAVAQMLKRLHGPAAVECIHSNDQRDSDNVIDRFRNGDQSYLVAVDMVSEGVDIPRLTTGLHLTPKRTELFMRQTVGRLLRTKDNHDQVTAAYYAPAHPDIRNILQNISNESDAGVCDRELVESARETTDRDRPDREVIILPSLDGPVVDAISHGQNTTVHDTELANEAQRLIREAGTTHVSLADAMALLAAQHRLANIQHKPVPLVNATQTSATNMSELPLDKQVPQLRSLLAKEVNRISRMTGEDQPRIYTSLSNEAFGHYVSTKKMTVNQLNKVLTTARARLNRMSDHV